MWFFLFSFFERSHTTYLLMYQRNNGQTDGEKSACHGVATCFGVAVGASNEAFHCLQVAEKVRGGGGGGGGTCSSREAWKQRGGEVQWFCFQISSGAVVFLLPGSLQHLQHKNNNCPSWPPGVWVWLSRYQKSKLKACRLIL